MGDEVTLPKAANVFFIILQKKEGTKYWSSHMHNIVHSTY